MVKKEPLCNMNNPRSLLKLKTNTLLLNVIEELLSHLPLKDFQQTDAMRVTPT